MKPGATKRDPPPSQITEQELDDRFTYHPPAGPEQITAYRDIRATARLLAGVLVETVPESRELSIALRKLDETVMWANAGVARRSE